MRHVGTSPRPHPAGCPHRRRGGRGDLPGRLIVPFFLRTAPKRRTIPRHPGTYAEKQWKCLSLNHLRARRSFSSQGQSRPIKPNQGVFDALRANCAPGPFLRFAAVPQRRQTPKSEAANFSYFHLISLLFTCFHFAAPPGRAGTLPVRPPGQTRSNPVKPQKPGLTTFAPDSESEPAGRSLLPQKGPAR